MAADPKTSYINTAKGPRTGSGIYRCYTLFRVGEKGEREQKMDHLSDVGETTLCERPMNDEYSLLPSKYPWKKSENQCEACLKKARKIRSQQKKLREHTKNQSCRGEAQETCPVCSIGDELRDIELPPDEDDER